MNNPHIEVTILGSGTSAGIPVIGCSCAVCKSDNPLNNRLRSSCLIRYGSLKLLIDCGPDFREQALRYQIDDLSNVLLTHGHADHTAGIDDLRAYYMMKRHEVNIFCDPHTLSDIQTRFAYCFREPPKGVTIPKLTLHEVPFCGTFEIRGGGGEVLQVQTIPVIHNSNKILGFRIGRFAYLTDVSSVPEEGIAQLCGLDVLVTTALRAKPHVSHMSLDEAVNFSQRIGARQTWFVHMNHEVEHVSVSASLPQGIGLTYDGQTFTVPLI